MFCSLVNRKDDFLISTKCKIYKGMNLLNYMGFIKCSFIAIVYSIFLNSCNLHNDKNYESPQGYNFSKPVIIHLRNDLDEISGIYYYKKDTSLFAISDENRLLYKIRLKKPVIIESWKLSVGSDFEDITLHDSTFYLLQSNGDIKTFDFTKGGFINTDVCTLPINGFNEFESMYYDAYNEKVVLVCKDCEVDNNQLVSAYNFNPLDKVFDNKPAYQLNGNEAKNIAQTLKTRFRPSAAAINPLTKELFIISATANTLVIADNKGNIKRAIKLDPKFFKQPEGIAFSPSGTLYISNEFAETGSANILVFKYNPSANEKI